MRLALLAVLLCACSRTGIELPDSGQLENPDSGSGGGGGGGAGGGSSGGCVPKAFADACAAVKDSVFASVTKGECGKCAQGYDCTCTWHLTFTGASAWSWQHSDYGESGSYSCAGFDLTGVSSLSTYAAHYDPTCDRVEWDGIVYRRGN